MSFLKRVLKDPFLVVLLLSFVVFCSAQLVPAAGCLTIMPLLLRHRTASALTSHHHCPALHTSSCCPDHADHSCACLVRHTSRSASQPPHAAGVLLRQSGLRSQQPEHAQPSPHRVVVAHAQRVFLCGRCRPELTLCCSLCGSLPMSTEGHSRSSGTSRDRSRDSCHSCYSWEERGGSCR